MPHSTATHIHADPLPAGRTPSNGRVPVKPSGQCPERSVIPVVPNKIAERIQYYVAHVDPWTDNAASIGLTEEQAADFTTLVTAARAAFDAAYQAREAAKNATTELAVAVQAMHTGTGGGADLIKTIRTYAETTGNPAVYGLAMIPQPKTPGALPPPGLCTDITVTLGQDGAIILTWKCSNPVGASGTSYEIMRSVAGADYTFVDNAGKKRYEDTGVPANASPVTYRITAVRAGVRGPVAQFTVSFGTAGPVVVQTVQTPQTEAA